jgi:hypothetical protein
LVAVMAMAVLAFFLVHLYEHLESTALHYQGRDYPYHGPCGHFPPASGLVRLHGVTGVGSGNRAFTQPWIGTTPADIFVVARNGSCIQAYGIDGGV